MIGDETTRNHFPLMSSRDLDPLLKKIDNASYVLLGEASHGTHEFYTWRTAISKRLIAEKGFSFIAVEGDWPDCYKINRFVKGYSDAGNSAVEVLREFQRWPTWMWANWEVAALLEWLREFNKSRPVGSKVGFYGVDVYSLRESMEVMIEYLRKEDPRTARLAVEAFRCFEPYEEGHDYGRAAINLRADCSKQVVDLLQSVRRKSRNYNHDPEASLNAEVNVQVIADAEEFYRSMVGFRDQSWNLRDAHMMDVLEAVKNFHGSKSKGIVWAHNTHVGDARYTDMQEDGMLNVGQLVREKHSATSYIVGFASYEGSVIAAKTWGSQMREIAVPPAFRDSLEDVLHRQSAENKLLLLDSPYWRSRFDDFVGHRAIGVVYNPIYESGNYVPTILPHRYDAMIYIDKSTALHPLHVQPNSSQVPETYPFGY